MTLRSITPVVVQLLLWTSDAFQAPLIHHIRLSAGFLGTRNVGPFRSLKVFVSEPEVVVEEETSLANTSAYTAVLEKPSEQSPRRALSVSSEIHLPFPAEVAFDAFSDLNRQPEWSPWLHKVEYISDVPGHTQWTLKVLGVSYSWISVATQQDRPYLIEWESVSGLKNFGQVQFEPHDECCHMTMTMTFVPPRLVAAVFRNAQGVRNFMEQRLIGSSLRLFRDVIVESTLSNAPNTTMLLFPI